jgi:hexosaminidase
VERVVSAQFLERLPKGPIFERSGPAWSVEFVHELPSWRGAASWQPTRERNETYSLSISQTRSGDRLVVDARTHWALANAMATLYQLLEIRRGQASIPGCPHVIRDAPAFPHRGLLLDTSRAYYPVSWIRDLISALTEFKINVLHLHLTDTTAWPVEVEEHPEVAQKYATRDIDGEPLTYSRADLRSLVDFARVRGMSLMPEIDGPMHAPAEADPPYTVAGSANMSTPDFAVEPPAGGWDLRTNLSVELVQSTLAQLQVDFSTSPFLHVGGDEPQVGQMCLMLEDSASRAQCLAQCTNSTGGGGSPWADGCGPTVSKPADANVTYWFPEVFNAMIQQDYFDQIQPEPKLPAMAWSGILTDVGVELGTDAAAKNAMQLWEFPGVPGRPGLTASDCARYELVQSAATHPQMAAEIGDDPVDRGWLYLECGLSNNWVSMGDSYWCSYASWVAIYSMNLTQMHGPAADDRVCQDAFIGGEVALWGEITGPGAAMSMIFPRIVAFAERTWTNPPALEWTQFDALGAPPREYWNAHLKDPLLRLNTVVSNLEMAGVGVSQLQPDFCRDHPSYCTNFTEPLLPSA